MQLRELLRFNDIVIQCHDNPDADALASGYALFWYFKKMGKHPRFIYRGRNEIRKSNLLIMVEELKVPVKYEPDFNRVPELLVTVDCQYGQQNVTLTKAVNVAVIDHHRETVDLPNMSEVRSSVGSCATVIWDMIRAEGLSVRDERLLSTALYYGLYTDTSRLSEMSHPLDRDMVDELVINKSIITEMSNSNISLEELRITGKAILDYDYYGKNKYLIIHADRCDPNILGVISDFAMETTGVNVCLAFYVSPDEIKFSVRSCVKEVHANEVAEFLSEDVGGGGGHMYKAGGTIRPEKLPLIGVGEDFESVFKLLQERMEDYFNKYEIIYARSMTLDTSNMPKYEKLPQHMGYVMLSDVYPTGTLIEIRTLEGDITISVTDDTYLMIGIEGEVYPIKKAKFEKSYKVTGEKYKGKFEYEPRIKDVASGTSKGIFEFARDAISQGGSYIYAERLYTYVKLFTAWDDEKYYSGGPGDYIASREDDPHDMYIIRGRLFGKLYKEV